MAKVLSTIDYWEEFHNNNPNPEPFRAFIAEYPTLTRIFNIVAVPNILFSAIDEYPFDKKLSEFSTISRDEVLPLYDADIRSIYGKKVGEWLGYLIALFELVGATIRFYDYLKKNSNLSGRKLLEHTSSAFNEYISVDKEIIYKTGKSEKLVGQRIGRILPRTLVEFLDVPGEIPKVIAQLHFRFNPTKELIRFLTNHLDFKSVLNFRRFRPLANGVTYGGFHPDLDGGFHSRQEGEKFLVEFFYKGKKIGRFEYSIRKRFKKELKRAAKDARDPLTRDGYIGYAEDELLRCIEEFDESKGKPPEHYFRASLKYAPLNIYKSESTTRLEHSGDKEYQIGTRKVGTLKNDWPEAESEDERNIEKHGKPSDKFEKAESKDVVYKLKKFACEDETDEKIIDLWVDGTGLFENSDEINYSAIARALETYDNDIRRRWEGILKRVNKDPALRDYFK